MSQIQVLTPDHDSLVTPEGASVTTEEIACRLQVCVLHGVLVEPAMNLRMARITSTEKTAQSVTKQELQSVWRSSDRIIDH